MRKKYLFGNWKMNKTGSETVAYSYQLKGLLLDQDLPCILGIFPTSLHLHLFNSTLYPGAKLVLGAQNIYHVDTGAYTGEISAHQLVSDGFKYTLIGHSERRQLFFETDEIINQKIIKAVNLNLNVVFCVGETLNEYNSGLTKQVLKTQIENGLKNFNYEHLSQLIIAYEPVWAIGTGITATPEEAQNNIAYIRNEILSKIFGFSDAQKISILYGGSVNLKNIEELTNKPDIDGALVGGASLNAEDFVAMAKKVK